MLVGVYLFLFRSHALIPCALAPPCHSPFESRRAKDGFRGLSSAERQKMLSSRAGVHLRFGPADRTDESMVLISFEYVGTNVAITVGN